MSLLAGELGLVLDCLKSFKHFLLLSFWPATVFGYPVRLLYSDHFLFSEQLVHKVSVFYGLFPFKFPMAFYAKSASIKGIEPDRSCSAWMIMCALNKSFVIPSIISAVLTYPFISRFDKKSERRVELLFSYSFHLVIRYENPLRNFANALNCISWIFCRFSLTMQWEHCHALFKR